MKKFVNILMFSLIAGCAPTIIREGKKMRYPEAFRYDMRLVEELIKKKDYKESIKRLEEIIAIYDGKTDISSALFYIGDCYVNLNGFDIAERYFKRLIEEYPDSKFRWRASLHLYRIYRDRKNTVMAIYYLKDAITNGMEPRYLPYFYFKLGEMEMEVGEKLNAFNAFIHSFLSSRDDTLKDLARSTALRIFKFHLTEAEKENLDYEKMPFFIKAEWLKEKTHRTGKLETENIETLLKIEGYPEEFTKIKEIVKGGNKLNPRKIGIILPMSGKYAEAGRRILEGLEMGLRIPNGDTSFTLIIRDAGEKEENYIYFLRELIEEKTGIIIGPPSTLLTQKSAPYISASRIPFISFSPDSEVAELSPYILRFFVNKYSQAKAIAHYAVENLGVKEFAILYPLDKFGFDFTNYFWDEIQKLGGEIRGVESYKIGTTDFSVPIKKILGLFYLDAREEYKELKREAKKGEEPEIPPVQDFSAILLPDSLRTLIYIIPQLNYYDADIRKITFLGSYLWNAGNVREIPSLVKSSVIFVTPFSLASDKERVIRFVQEYTALYRHPPDIFSAFAYDLGGIIYTLFKDKGEMDGNEIVENFLSVQNYDGVNGKISFLPNGDILHENVIRSVKDIESSQENFKSIHEIENEVHRDER